MFILLCKRDERMIVSIICSLMSYGKVLSDLKESFIGLFEKKKKVKCFKFSDLCCVNKWLSAIS